MPDLRKTCFLGFFAHTNSSVKLGPVCLQKLPRRQSHRPDTGRARPSCSQTASGWAACASSPAGIYWSLHGARRWWWTGYLRRAPWRCGTSCCCSCRLVINRNTTFYCKNFKYDLEYCWCCSTDISQCKMLSGKLNSQIASLLLHV